MRTRLGSLRKGSDADGNLTMRAQGAADSGGIPDFAGAGETWVYEYDLSNRLKSARKGSAGPVSAVEVARYEYDWGFRV